MGACYSIELKVKLLDEAGAVKALQEHIKNDTHSNYSLDQYAKQGIKTDTFDNLMRIIFAGWKHQELDIQEIDGTKYYSNDFDASYGWEMVMILAFEVLIPFIADGSTLEISVDNDYEKLVIKNGKIEAVA